MGISSIEGSSVELIVTKVTGMSVKESIYERNSKRFQRVMQVQPSFPLAIKQQETKTNLER